MDNQIINDYKKIIFFTLNDMKLSHRKDELFDIGMIGFVKGINTYKESMNVKCITYLYSCIKNEILHHISYENCKMRSGYDVISLNTLIGDKTELQDFIGYEVDYLKDYCDRESIEVLKFEIENLPYTDQLILNHLFGLNGYERMSATQISQIFGINRRSIYCKRIKFLRAVKKKLNEMGYLYE